MKNNEITTIKRRLRTAFLILSTMLFACAAEAQNKGIDLQNKTPEQRAEQQTSLMKKSLNPDDAQLEKIKAINLKYAYKFDPILKSEDNKMSKFKQARELQQAKEAELKAVFTPEQYKKYEEMKKEMASRLKSQIP